MKENLKDALTLESGKALNTSIKPGILKKIEKTVEPLGEEEKPYFNIPSSSGTNLFYEVLAAGADLADLPARAKQVSHSRKVAVVESGNKRQVTVVSDRASATLELENINKIMSSNKGAKKLFILALKKANERALSKGMLISSSIGFPLQELIARGIYKNIRSARAGFNNSMDILTSLKLKGKLTMKGRGKEVAETGLEVLFTGANIRKGYCTVYLNDRLNYNLITPFFTILPQYYFELGNRAADLLYYIFYLARQNVEKIGSHGCFNISFRALQAWLNLPSEINNREPGKTIKEPLEKAVEDIETANRKYNGRKPTEEIGFTMELVCSEDASIMEYLNSGYLKVMLKGDYAKDFKGFLEKNQDKARKALERKQAMEDLAIAALHLKDKLKEQDKKTLQTSGGEEKDGKQALEEELRKMS